MRLALPRGDLDFVLEHTEDVWRSLSGARVLITGATGFIGSWLVESIQHANDALCADIHVTALTRSPDAARQAAPFAFSRPDMLLVQGDVRSGFAAAPGGCDVVIHGATDVGRQDRLNDHITTFDVCVEGTRRVLEEARRRGAARFLLMSSGAVYGTQPPNLARVPEIFTGSPSCTDPRSAYGEGKRAAEWLACATGIQTGMAVSIARIYALLGPNLPLGGPFAAGNFIRDALQGRPVRVQSDGRSIRSYLYASDACIWLWRMLLAGTPGGAVYNLGSEEQVSIRALAELVGQLSNSPVEAQIADTAPSEGLPPRYVPDTTKARTELSLEEFTPLHAAIQKTIEWNRKSIQA